MSNVNIDESLVVKGCLNGDIRSQKQLYDRYKNAMFVHCMRYAVDKSEAEDMLQEGFLIVFKELHQYDSTRGALGGWIRRVIINAALQMIRKKKINFAEITTLHEEVLADDDAIAQIGLKELLGYIQKLPSGYRTVFNMYVIDDMKHNEIAEILQISVNTSKTQLFKAKQILQKMVLENQKVAISA
jgi:RNA polymerase sigma factor (sigma-70 family)